MKFIGLMLPISTLSSRYVVDAMELSKLPKAALPVPTDTPSDIKPVNNSGI
jgi:hypothetical protein